MQSEVIKEAVVRLRQFQGDEQATRQYLLWFIRRGMQAGYNLDAVITILALGPGSIMGRVFYRESEQRRLIEYLKSLTIEDLLADDGELPS